MFRRQAMGLVTAEQAVEIERLGYGAVWAEVSPPAGLWSSSNPSWRQPKLATVATGIVNIWTAVAEPVAELHDRIEQAYPGRFLLGIGVGHAKHIDQYRKPCEALVEYLDELDSYGCRPIAVCGARSAGVEVGS